jgi:glucokinase
MPKRSRMLLAGDIGGTKTKLAVYRPEDGLRAPVDLQIFPSANYASLEALVADFLKGRDWSIGRASFGVAGPVSEGRVRVTNLDWVDDERSLGTALKMPVTLVNDLVAVACAIPLLDPGDAVTLNAGTPQPEGAIGVVAPGTGLGEAFLVWAADRYVPCPSEGGHADFAPTNLLEADLLAYMLPRHLHISYELICSGLGLPNLYAFLRDTSRFPQPTWLAEELAQAVDPTPVIVQAALDNKADLCVETLRLFVAIMGSEVGNLALKVYATGGVYIAGGIPPRILPFLQGEGFLQSLKAKGRFSGMMANLPVKVIVNPDAGLIGAASHGLEDGRENV